MSDFCPMEPVLFPVASVVYTVGHSAFARVENGRLTYPALA